MTDQILKKVVYSYYPRNICFSAEIAKYLASEEYKKLHQRIKKFDSESRLDISRGILKEFQKEHSLSFEDFSLFDSGERCMTFSITICKGSELYTISLLLSIIVPYYIIRVKKNTAKLWLAESKIASIQRISSESKKISDIVLMIGHFASKRLGQKKFPKKLVHHIMHDVSYQEIGIGNFTMYNAFFNNLKLDASELP